MAKQIIYDISEAVNLKYVETTRWVFTGPGQQCRLGGLGGGLFFRPASMHESPSLEIECYDVVYEIESQDEHSVPFTDEIKIGEALSLDDHSPFLITIKGRKYHQYWGSVPLEGNAVINRYRYLSDSVPERCPDGWAGDLPDYLDYHGLYRAADAGTEETEEE